MVLDYSGVNWLGVVVAAAAAIVIGFAWYSRQLFGVRWAELAGRPVADVGRVPAYGQIVGGVVVALVTAWVLAVLAKGVGVTGLGDGALLGFLAWLGFYATTSAGSVLWEGRPPSLWYINAGNGLVTFVVMGAIIGLWH